MTAHTKIFKCTPFWVVLLFIGLFAASTTPTPLQAASGAWKSTTPGSWNTAAKWTLSSVPNGIDQEAGFIGFPNTMPFPIITGAATIGSLHVHIPHTPTAIALSIFATLTFSSSSTATITAGSNLTMAGQVTLQSNLNIDPQSREPNSPFPFKTLITFSGFSGGIVESPPGSGKSVTINGEGLSTSQVVYNAANTYTGMTTVNGNLSCTAADTIPANALINPLGTLDCSTSNGVFHIPSSPIVDVKGTLANGIGITQTLGQLHVIDKGSVNAGNFTLTDLTFPLTMGGGTIAVDLLTFQNGGTITYDPTLSDTLSTIQPTASTIAINLSGNTVDLKVPPRLTTFSGDVGLKFINADFSMGGGALTKSGSGTVAFETNAAATIIPDFTVNAGTVLITNSSLIQIANMGGFTINAGGALNGTGALQAVLMGPVNVVNNGVVEPGQPLFGDIGTLVITGTYNQSSTGSLFIKGANMASHDQLIVSAGGTVMLGGALVFNAQPGSTFNPGDQIVVLDNTGGNITGAFSSFRWTAPSNVKASMVQTGTQVIIQFTANQICPICPICPPVVVPPSPPTNLKGVRIKDQFALQTDLINRLTWTPSPSAGVVGYQITRNGQLIATVPSSTYEDHDRKKKEVDVYTVKAVSINGLVSSSVTVTVL